MSEEPHPKRRRNRVVVVCHRCRQKKARCDKKYPCNQCQRAGFAGQCLYDGPIPAKVVSDVELDETFKDSVNRLVAFFRQRSPRESVAKSSNSISAPHNKYMIGECPMVPSSDRMNIHMRLYYPGEGPDLGSALEPPDFIELRFVKVFHNFKASQQHTFSVELSQQDPAVKIYWENSLSSEDLMLMTIQNLEPRRRNEVVRAASIYFGPLFFSSNRMNSAMTREQLSMYGQPLGFVYTPDYSDKDPFQTSLRKFIPAKPVLFAFLARFFAKIYPIYPIIDEQWAYSEVNRLFNFSGSDKTYVSANMASRDDVIVVSIILFMLALSHLSYFTNIRAHNERILDSVLVGGKRLRDVSISLQAIDLATSMLLKGSSRFRSSFTLLQAHTLRMIYKLVSHESETAFCDVDGTSGVDFLLLMAVSLMMERDPDNVVNFPGDEKERNLRRKLWYTLIHIAYTGSFLFLSPKNLYRGNYHTKLPVFDPKSSNLCDLKTEEKVIDQLRETHEIFIEGNKLLDLTINTTLLISGATLVQSLNDYECFVQEKYGVIDDFFTQNNTEQEEGYDADEEPVHTPDIFDIAKLKVFLTLRLFISYLTYFLHLYYRYKHNQRLSFIFLKKSLLIYLNEFSYLGSELMFSQEKYFDAAFALMVSPTIMIVKQSAFIFSLAFAISLKCGIIEHGLRQDNLRDIQLMRTLLWKAQDSALPIQRLSRLLSERYFYAWKCAKINSFGYKLVDKDDFFTINPKKLYNTAFYYTNEQIKDLIDCIRDECPIEVSNLAEFESQCYQTDQLGIDHHLTGTDLYKTLQTDNFWIVLKTLAERTYASQYLSNEPDPQVGGAQALDILEVLEPSADAHDAPAVSLHLLDPLNNVALLEPDMLQILDINMFSANWKPENGLHGDELEAPGGVL